MVNEGTEANAVAVHSAMPMKQQVLFLNQGQDANGRTMPYGARYILHMPNGSTAEVSTNSMGSMSMSGKPLRTMASLFHAGARCLLRSDPSLGRHLRPFFFFLNLAKGASSRLLELEAPRRSERERRL